ncbi:hypothetical protein HG530_011158 [Fusarium avenaceum]|nr:hypothetical protein HG530_011158 [Fusarium avenaceum]
MNTSGAQPPPFAEAGAAAAAPWLLAPASFALLPPPRPRLPLPDVFSWAVDPAAGVGAVAGAVELALAGFLTGSDSFQKTLVFGKVDIGETLALVDFHKGNGSKG